MNCARSNICHMHEMPRLKGAQTRRIAFSDTKFTVPNFKSHYILLPYRDDGVGKDRESGQVPRRNGTRRRPVGCDEPRHDRSGQADEDVPVAPVPGHLRNRHDGCLSCGISSASTSVAGRHFGKRSAIKPRAAFASRTPSARTHRRTSGPPSASRTQRRTWTGARPRTCSRCSTHSTPSRNVCAVRIQCRGIAAMRFWTAWRSAMKL